MTPEQIQQQYLAMGAMLYGVALRYVPCAEDAEDAVQDAFVAIWRGRERLAELTSEEGRRYFVRAVRNTCINRLRQHREEAVGENGEGDLSHPVPDSAAPPDEQLSARDDLEHLHRLVEALPPKQGEAFRLFHFCELEIGETARRMGETEAYVRLLLSRARRTIRERFQPNPQSHPHDHR